MAQLEGKVARYTLRELGLDLPYRDHLLSQTLFLELFQNNLVSAEGEIKGTAEEFNKYRSILARRYAERTAILYEMRKQLVKEAEKLLKNSDRSSREEILLKKILDELDLELTGDEIIIPCELKPPRRYLGSPEPMLSIFERKLKEEEHRRKVLRKDLKILDKWLENISTLDTKVIERHSPITVMSWTEFKKKHHAKLWNRMSEMDRARHTFIKHINTFNDTLIKKLLAPRKKKIEGDRMLRKKRQQLIHAKNNPPPPSKKALSKGRSSSSNTMRSSAKIEKTSKDYQERDSVSLDDDRKVGQKPSLKSLSKSEESSHATLTKSKEKLRDYIKDNLDQKSSEVESMASKDENDSQENVRKKLSDLEL